MISVEETVIANVLFAGGMANGKVTYLDNELIFRPDGWDNVMKGLGSKSNKQVFSIAYKNIERMVKGKQFFFIPNKIILVLSEQEAPNKYCTLYTQRRDEVYDFLMLRIGAK